MVSASMVLTCTDLVLLPTSVLMAKVQTQDAGGTHSAFPTLHLVHTTTRYLYSISTRAVAD